MDNRTPLTRGQQAYPHFSDDVGVTNAHDPDSKNLAPPITIFKARAIWDTGASTSMITKRVVSALQLQPVGYQTARTPLGEHQVKIYLVNIHLRDNPVFAALSVIEGDLPEADVLIGMDIIGKGNFAIKQKNGKSRLHFKIPSQQKSKDKKKRQKKKIPKSICEFARSVWKLRFLLGN